MAISEKEFMAAAKGDVNLKINGNTYELVGEQQPLGYIFQSLDDNSHVTLSKEEVLDREDIEISLLTEQQYVEKLNTINVQNTEVFNKTDYAVALLQIKPDLPERRDIQFSDYDSACIRLGGNKTVEPKMYNTVYIETMTKEQMQDFSSANAIGDYLYKKMNYNRPSALEGYFGQSASVSDVIVIKNEKDITSLYVENFGYKKLEDFSPKVLKEKNREETPER